MIAQIADGAELAFGRQAGQRADEVHFLGRAMGEAEIIFEQGQLGFQRGEMEQELGRG